MNKRLKTLIRLSPALLLATAFTTSQAHASSISHHGTHHLKLAKATKNHSHAPISFLPQQLHEYVFHCPLNNNAGHPPAGNPPGETPSTTVTESGSGSTWTTGIVIVPQPPLTAPPVYEAVITPAASAVPVPVPAAVWLLSSGLRGLGLTAKSRHRDSRTGV